MHSFRLAFTNVKNRLKKILKRKKRGRPKKRRLFPVKTVGTLLVIIGLFIALFPFVYKKSTEVKLPKDLPKQESLATPSASKNVDSGPIKIDPALLSTKEPSQPPERIIILSQKINLPVVEAKVIDGYWELSETTASHGVGSANPGEIGNTVIFAHAREGLFLPLKDVKEDDEIVVLTKDRWYRYEVKEIKDVDPNQTEVIAPTKDETLTLYTCSGFLDSKRRIVIAKREF